MFKHKNWLMVIVASLSLFSGAAFAGTVTNPALGLGVTVFQGPTQTANWSLGSNAAFITNPDGTFTYTGTNPTNSVWSFDWDVTVKPDPFINASLSITNLASTTQTFNILFSLPVGSSFAPGSMSGSLGGSFTDLNTDGLVSLANINWSGIIDANPSAMSLLAFGGTCGPGSFGCTINLSTVNGGPTLYPAGVTSSIGLKLAFDLSAGDKATFNTSFAVVPVPVPAAVWLFGSGLLALGGLARRRKN